MGSVSRIVGFYVVSAVVSAVVESKWTYLWPYGPNRTCGCRTTEPLPRDDPRPTFDTEVECLRGFAESTHECCEYEGLAVVAEQCEVAYATTGLPNTECQARCFDLVAGDFATEQDKYFKDCDFDFASAFPSLDGRRLDDNEDDCDNKHGFTIAVLPDSCYSNYVWGFSDYNSSNAVHVSKTKYFEGVPSYVSCQSLCQQTDDCAFFSWRAYSDVEAREDGMQNPPDSCILYNQEFMDEITAFVVEDSFPPTQSDLCDMEQAAVCKTLPWEDGKFSLFSDYPCQTCDCQARCSWESPVHITGPAFCENDVRETCTFKRPVLTSTLPPCEPLDDRTTELEEGTAETDTALITEAARARIDSETTNIVFSEENPTEDDPAGTAETDFATVSDSTTEVSTVELSSESTIELRHI